MASYISVITDEEKSLTKHFSLDPDTNMLVKSAAEHLTKGTIEAICVGPDELQEVVEGMLPNQCLCLGVLDQPGVQRITIPWYCLLNSIFGLRLPTCW